MSTIIVGRLRKYFNWNDLKQPEILDNWWVQCETPTLIDICLGIIQNQFSKCPKRRSALGAWNLGGGLEIFGATAKRNR